MRVKNCLFSASLSAAGDKCRIVHCGWQLCPSQICDRTAQAVNSVNNICSRKEIKSMSCLCVFLFRYVLECLKILSWPFLSLWMFPHRMNLIQFTIAMTSPRCISLRFGANGKPLRGPVVCSIHIRCCQGNNSWGDELSSRQHQTQIWVNSWQK